MIQIKLPANRQLQIENAGDKLRLAILSDGSEWVCRKDSFRNLENFMQENESHIFKGRLQLFKYAGKISIEVKGETVGVITTAQLKKSVTGLKANT